VDKLEQPGLSEGKTTAILIMIPGALRTINLKNNYTNPLPKIILNYKLLKTTTGRKKC
jgi:hypothetical protein